MAGFSSAPPPTAGHNLTIDFSSPLFPTDPESPKQAAPNSSSSTIKSSSRLSSSCSDVSPEVARLRSEINCATGHSSSSSFPVSSLQVEKYAREVYSSQDGPENEPENTHKRNHETFDGNSAENGHEKVTDALREPAAWIHTV